jgi:hypothetical protein
LPFDPAEDVPGVHNASNGYFHLVFIDFTLSLHSSGGIVAPTQECAQSSKAVSSVAAVSSTEGSNGIGEAECWRLAYRIASSRGFGRSELLRKLLFHLCSCQAQGLASELTERQIGIHVFGRVEGYNSNDDNIVRNYIRRLRKRIEEYFAGEGRHEELGLDIPRGSYVPVFYSRLSKKPLEESSPGETSSASPLLNTELPEAAPVAHPRRIVLLVILSIVLIASVAIASRSLLKTGGANSGNPAAQANPSTALWSQLFQKDRDTFIVTADSGLVILEELIGRSVSLDEYSSGKYRSAAAPKSKLSSADVEELGTRRYTSTVDLELVLRLFQLKEVHPERLLVRYARDLRMDNLRSGNAILLGSADANPWASLFEQQLNFRFSYNPGKRPAPVILNQRPLAGEQPAYRNDYQGPWHRTYGTVSWQPNLDGAGHVLLIAGIDMAGTEAAGAFVLNPSLMKPILNRATTPSGAIRPFELLIESDNVAANASRPQAVIERIGN